MNGLADPGLVASGIMGKCRLLFAADAVLVSSLGMFLFGVTLQKGFEHQNHGQSRYGRRLGLRVRR